MPARGYKLLLIFGMMYFLKPGPSILAQQYIGDSLEISKISTVSKAFSAAYMREDIETLTKYYTEHAKIMPPNAPIIEGHVAIQNRWFLPEGIDILLHEAIPEEIRIVGNYAYDYGIYRGKTKNLNGKEVSWRGKYLIVWEKTEDNWKIYLDIWNSLPEIGKD